MTFCLLSVVKNTEKVALLERAITAHREYTQMVRTADYTDTEFGKHPRQDNSSVTYPYSCLACVKCRQYTPGSFMSLVASRIYTLYHTRPSVALAGQG